MGAAHSWGPDDFPRLVAQFAGGDTSTNPSRAARALFAIRWKLGALLGWDDPDAGNSSRRPTLRDRLPEDLRDAPGPDFKRLPRTGYMAAIMPFRHLIVYPPLMREISAEWQALAVRP